MALRVELASGRKLRDRNKPAYRLAHWPIWIFVFFIVPGPSTFQLFEHGFDGPRLIWLGLVILGTGIAALRGRLPGVEPRPYIIRFVEDKPNPLYRRICYTFAWSIVITFAVLNFTGLVVAVATGVWRLKQIYEYGYFPLAIVLWAMGAMGWLPRVKASTKGEGHERRYFYGAVWASCVAQPVLGILWKLLPHTRTADVAKLVVFTGLLGFCGVLARRGLLPKNAAHPARRAGHFGLNAGSSKCVTMVVVALRPMKLFLCFVTVALWAQAGEFVVLSNGFRIHADTHAADGPVIRLQTSQGIIEIQASSVAAFEEEEYIAPVAVPSVPPNPQPTQLTPQQLITQAALHAGLPPAIVHSIARAESGYREDAVSPKGAIGLMQLMPKTAAELEADPHDPAQNAEAGARYLRDLLQKYENDPHQVSKAVAAYNAGPAAVDKYHGIPPYRETIQYVNRVLKQYEKEQAKQKAD